MPSPSSCGSKQGAGAGHAAQLVRDRNYQTWRHADKLLRTHDPKWLPAVAVVVADLGQEVRRLHKRLSIVADPDLEDVAAQYVSLAKTYAAFLATEERLTRARKHQEWADTEGQRLAAEAEGREGAAWARRQNELAARRARR